MPTYPIQLKRNGTAAATPSSLLHGEVALNYADGKLFWKDASNVIQSFTFQAYALSSHTHAASDITSGTLDAARIANDSITYAKLQNVSATDRLLGRSSAGAGDVEEITCTAFGRSLIDDADAAAARSTLSVQPTASPAFTGAATVTNDGNVVPLTVTNTGTANSFVVNDASGDTTPFLIDASGNVGIGTSSPTALLSVAASGSPQSKIDGFETAQLRGSTVSYLRVSGGAVDTLVGSEEGGGTSFIGTFTNHPVVIRTNNEERLRITAGGQLLVTAGSGSAGSYKPGVAVSGDDDTGLQQVGGANTISLVTAGSERMRADASGNVGIGVTPAASTTSNVQVSGDITLYGASRSFLGNLYFQSGWKYAGTGHGWGWIEGSGNVDFARTSSSGTAGNTATLTTAIRINSGSEVLIGTTTDNGAYLLQVNSQIYATNATIATSDARFKTNVEPLTDATAVIAALRPVAFDFIPHAERNFATERQVGLIAQEAQSALAGTDYAGSVVAQCGDHLGLAYEKLVPVLIRALQESNARIAALEERLNHA